MSKELLEYFYNNYLDSNKAEEELPLHFITLHCLLSKPLIEKRTMGEYEMWTVLIPTDIGGVPYLQETFKLKLTKKNKKVVKSRRVKFPLDRFIGSKLYPAFYYKRKLIESQGSYRYSIKYYNKLPILIYGWIKELYGPKSKIPSEIL